MTGTNLDSSSDCSGYVDLGEGKKSEDGEGVVCGFV